MKHTARHNLNLPDTTDYVDIGALNENAVKIDGVLGGLEDSKARLDPQTEKLAISQMPGIIMAGAAALISDLPIGGILFITDDASVRSYMVPLEEVLTQGYLAATGQPDTLAELLTPGVAKSLNLRRDALGSVYTQADIGTLCADITSLCTAAVAAGLYVNEDASRVEVTWQQVEYWIVHHQLVSSTLALAADWTWGRMPDGVVQALREDVAEVKAIIGDVNAVLDEVNEGS